VVDMSNEHELVSNGEGHNCRPRQEMYTDARDAVTALTRWCLSPEGGFDMWLLVAMLMARAPACA
jgi:hypothetical protein